ncbi:MAG: DUF1015 family protein [Verrucomicrobia bacterium]|nr:DUF1015 family protein [Verrucomicrobiota bacterium]MBU4290021.1 DUF1015 family protein [Verrucomicrobiota bacterium]MBU4430079.1 DUF1015 family protein [Verrucomicrobiota bacterium]MCG2679608.1 DUF1015 family protein [Kiritimatiellia bacterium]
MIRIHPFKALHPLKRLVTQVSCVPYDVVDRAEAAALARDNPLSFLHVSRSEIDLPESANPYADEVYARAALNFKALLKQHVFIRDSMPCLYLYRLQRGMHIQRGIVACCHADDYEHDIIRKHEKTRKDKEDDRTRHMATIGAQGGLVFLTYRDNAGIDDQVRLIEATRPSYDFTAPDGVIHTIWRIRKTESLVNAFKEIPVCYIADGHHRAASAARVARERREANPSHHGMEDYNWFPSVLFPAGQLQILSYNRCVRDFNGKTEAEFLAAVRAQGTLTTPAPQTPVVPGHVSMYCAGRWYDLALKPEATEDPVSILDVSLLQSRILAPILGIADPRTDKRIDFIGGIRGTQELEQRVHSGKAAVAFSLFPVTVRHLMAIADAGQIMPPKSTWFEPKVRSGLLIHTF